MAAVATPDYLARNRSLASNARGNDADLFPANISQPKDGKDKDTEEEMKCTMWSWSPDCLQLYARPIPFLIAICALVLVQSLLITGYTNSILTTIEKRYSFMSSELGVIVGSYDITSIVTGIIVSYFGDSHNRPQWLGRGALVMALGSFLFTIPYFLGPRYDPSKYFTSNLNNGTLSGGNLCSNSIVKNLPCNKDQDFRPFWPLVIFLLAKMTLGIGSAPVYILGATYLFDNVNPKNYSVYAGIMYSMGAIGPAVGFFMGGMCLTIYENPGGAPPGLTKQHTAWVGAWWLGFLINSVLCIIVALPLMMFPRRLPNVSRESVTERPAELMTLNIKLKDMPQQIMNLFTNGIWVAVTLALIMEQSLSSGYVTFIAKYFQLAFTVPASSANVLTGTIIIPGAFMGIIAGGIIMLQIQADLKKTAKLLLGVNFFPICCMIGMMFLSCNNINLAGVTTSYWNYDERVTITGEVKIKYKGNLTSVCNTACACTQSVYEPVCGDDQITYYSPCHAGCTKLDMHTTDDGLLIRNYSQCGCIYEDFVHSAQTGKCKQQCSNLAPFLILLFISIFSTCCGQNPALVVTLRSVTASLRSFGLGMQFVLVKLFAFIPAPVYFGRIFDSQCLLWAPSCNGTGSCLEYDRKLLPFMLFGTGLGLKLLAVAAILYIYISSKAKEEESSEKNMKPVEEVQHTSQPQQPKSILKSSDPVMLLSKEVSKR